MRYAIEGLSQKKLIDHKLDCRDAVFLRWFIDFQTTKKMRFHVEHGDVYHWIDHSTVIEELPILGISRKDSMSRYISGLIDKRAIERHIIKRGKDKGTEVYYRIVPDLAYEMISDGEHKADQPSATQGRTAESDPSTTIPLEQKEEGEAKDPNTHGDKETREAPQTPAPFSQKVEKTLTEQAPGTTINSETRKAIDRFGEKHGGDALRDVVSEYINEKEREKILKYVNIDLPQKLEYTELDLEPPPQKRPESKRCEYGHVYAGEECFVCERERPYRESGREMPVCPSCKHDQIEEVKGGAYGCLRCGYDYKMLARDYFEAAAEAKAS